MQNALSTIRGLFIALFVNLLLMYIIWIMGKSLDSLIPCSIVWILLAVNGIRNPARNNGCSSKH